MRYRLLIIVAFSLPCWAQQHWCTVDSKFDATIAEKVRDLRWGLQAVSKLPDVEPIRLAKLADNSITSLSNLHSLRSGYLRNCDKSPDEYYSALDSNETFAAIFVRTIAAEQFRNGDQRSTAEVERLLAGPSAQKDFKFDETIERVIHRRMSSTQDHASALWVACMEIDGGSGRPEIKEIEIRPSPIISVQSDNPLAKPYGEVLPTLKKLSWREALGYLGNYYQGQD